MQVVYIPYLLNFGQTKIARINQKYKYMIHISFGLNDSYSPSCGVMMISICENNRDAKINFHILQNDISEKNKSKLEKIAEKYSQKITFYTVNDETLTDCPLGRAHFGVLSAYYRILLPLIVTPSIGKILYLDCDMVCVGSLKELFETDIEHYALAAIPAANMHDISYYNRLEYDMADGYFNSGVLLINLKYWHKNNVTNRLLGYIEKNRDKLIFFDQDALNYVLRKEKKFVSIKYNVNAAFYLKDPLIGREYWQDMMESRVNPVIIHYTGSAKPWNYECTHPMRQEFWRYAKLSPWKFKHSYVSLKSALKYYLKILSSKAGLIPSERDLYITV